MELLFSNSGKDIINGRKKSSQLQVFDNLTHFFGSQSEKNTDNSNSNNRNDKHNVPDRVKVAPDRLEKKTIRSASVSKSGTFNPGVRHYSHKSRRSKRSST